jgi:nicotinamidase-related amidase
VLHDLNSGNRCCRHPDAQPAENKAYFNASHRERALYTMAQALLNFGLDVASMLSESSRVRGAQLVATLKQPKGVITAEPEPVELYWTVTALVIIDMQRDFMEPGGFGETLGNDVSRLATAVKPIASVLKAARDSGMLVVHTREGHLPDLSDAPPAKVERGAPSLRIGDPGPMGRILIRGEAGHDIIPALYPIKGEIVIDKPGKGAFYATELGDILKKHAIENLLVCGVTTEVCVNTTVREGNDRGYRCVVISDGCASYFPEFHEMGLNMIKAQGGIFGWVADSAAVLQAMASETSHALLAGASK